MTDPLSESELREIGERVRRLAPNGIEGSFNLVQVDRLIATIHQLQEDRDGWRKQAHYEDRKRAAFQRERDRLR